MASDRNVKGIYPLCVLVDFEQKSDISRNATKQAKSDHTPTSTLFSVSSRPEGWVLERRLLTQKTMKLFFASPTGDSEEEHQKELEESRKWRDKKQCVCPQGFQSPAEL